MDPAHCLIDDVTGRGYLCLDYESSALLLFELKEVPEGIQMQVAFDLDPLERNRLRDLGPLSEEATMLDCIEILRLATAN